MFMIHGCRPAALCGLWFVFAALFTMLSGCRNDPSDSSATAQQFRPVESAEQKSEATTPNSENKSAGLPKVAIAPTPSPNAQANGEQTTPPPMPPANLEKPAGEAKMSPEESAIPAEYQAKLKQLRELENVRPRGTTREQQAQFVLNALNTRLTLAEGLALDPAAPEVVREEALVARLNCYAVLLEAQQPEAREKFAVAAKDLSELKNPKLANLGKTQLFSLKVMEIFSLQPRDGKEIVASMKNLLNETGPADIAFQACVRVLQVMESQQFLDDSVEAMSLLGETFAASTNPEISLQARGMQMSGLMLSIQNAEGEKADEIQTQLVAKLSEIVKLSQGDTGALELGLNVARILEGISNGARAMPVYELLETTYGKDSNEKLAKATMESVRNAKLRIGLVGKPLEVTGQLRDGSKFDWAAYRGKVVLVDFWATWCGPCLAEMSNIRRNYDRFHELGFEVIGINIDDNADDLKQFFEKQQLPWATVVSAEKDRVGFETPLAAACGVDAIPFVVLLDRDGKVAAIHVRGERLEKQLEAMLGNAPAAEKKEPNAETKPDAAPAPEEKAVPADKAASEEKATPEKN